MILDEIKKMPDGPGKAKELAIGGLLAEIGEPWHKQWYLERILEALGYDLEEIHNELQVEGYDWEPGIAP